MGGACVVDYLAGKEKVGVILGQGISFLDVFGPLEQKDKSVYSRLNAVNKIVILKTIDFLDLSCGSSDLLDQLSKDPWIGLDSTPLIKHFLYI